jgi:hypothetical protein
MTRPGKPIHDRLCSTTDGLWTRCSRSKASQVTRVQRWLIAPADPNTCAGADLIRAFSGSSKRVRGRGHRGRWLGSRCSPARASPTVGSFRKTHLPRVASTLVDSLEIEIFGPATTTLKGSGK